MLIRFAVIFTFCAMSGVGGLHAEENGDASMKLRKTGETKMCIRKGDIFWYNIVSTNMILFSTRDGYYLNQVSGKCYFPPNNDNARVTVYTKAGRPNVYCRNDAITAGRVYGPGSRCRLRMFEEAVEVDAEVEAGQ